MYDDREEFKGWFWSVELPKVMHIECINSNFNREKSKIEATYNSVISFIKFNKHDRK